MRTTAAWRGRFRRKVGVNYFGGKRKRLVRRKRKIPAGKTRRNKRFMEMRNGNA